MKLIMRKERACIIYQVRIVFAGDILLCGAAVVTIKFRIRFGNQNIDEVLLLDCTTAILDADVQNVSLNHTKYTQMFIDSVTNGNERALKRATEPRTS